MINFWDSSRTKSRGRKSIRQQFQKSFFSKEKTSFKIFYPRKIQGQPAPKSHVHRFNLMQSRKNPLGYKDEKTFFRIPHSKSPDCKILVFFAMSRVKKCFILKSFLASSAVIKIDLQECTKSLRGDFSFSCLTHARGAAFEIAPLIQNFQRSI